MDQKAAVVGGVILAFLGATAAGVYYLVIGQSGEEDFTAVETSQNISFPSSPKGATLQDTAPSAQGREPLERIPPPNDWGGGQRRDARQPQSSLGFVSGGDVKGADHIAGAENSEEAAEAMQKGDIGGMLKGMKENKGQVAGAGAEQMSSGQIREVMQTVVDGVHNLQPTWYEDFLANKYLKRIADRYHKTNDFARFLKDLGTSKAFYAMVKNKYKTGAMKSLTRDMFRDKRLGKDLTTIFLEQESVSHAYPLISRFGAAAGLPEMMVKTAKSKTKTSGSAYDKRKSVRKARQRKTLRKVGMNGFEDSGNSSGPAALGAATKTGGAPKGGMPEGFDPSKIPPEYQKYLKK